MASPNRNTNDMVIIYAAFLILEVAIGMYFPAMSYLKSQIIPEGKEIRGAMCCYLAVLIYLCGEVL